MVALRALGAVARHGAADAGLLVDIAVVCRQALPHSSPGRPSRQRCGRCVGRAAGRLEPFGVWTLPTCILHPSRCAGILVEFLSVGHAQGADMLLLEGCPAGTHEAACGSPPSCCAFACQQSIAVRYEQ